MEIVSNLDDFEAPWGRCALTLGDFDGLHRGHRTLIDTTVRHGRKLHLPAVVVTYDPSPKKVLKKLRTDSNVYTREEKIILLQEYPIRAVVFIPFDEHMAKMKADNFLDEILLGKLRAKDIVIGYDHKFGHNREGDFDFLEKRGREGDFGVQQIKPVKLFRELISSTRIRKYLREGKIKRANRLLGHPYLLTGTIIVGKQRGRQLGIPTANLNVHPEKLIPKEGVYLCNAQYGSQIYKAVVNIGFNPTFKNVNLSVEAHLLDFDDDIYGERLKLTFRQRLRDEKRFDSIDALVTQINKDITRARRT